MQQLTPTNGKRGAQKHESAAAAVVVVADPGDDWSVMTLCLVLQEGKSESNSLVLVVCMKR
jgi:hypothetical protein